MAHCSEWDEWDADLCSNGLSIDEYYKYRDKYDNQNQVEELISISPSFDPMARMKVAAMINKLDAFNKNVTMDTLDDADTSAEIGKILRETGNPSENVYYKIDSKNTLPNVDLDDDKILIAGLKGQFLTDDHFELKPLYSDESENKTLSPSSLSSSSSRTTVSPATSTTTTSEKRIHYDSVTTTTDEELTHGKANKTTPIKGSTNVKDKPSQSKQQSNKQKFVKPIELYMKTKKK